MSICVGATKAKIPVVSPLPKDLLMDKLEDMIVPETLPDLPQLGRDILKGQVKGRVVVDVNARGRSHLRDFGKWPDWDIYLTI